MLSSLPQSSSALKLGRPSPSTDMVSCPWPTFPSVSLPMTVLISQSSQGHDQVHMTKSTTHSARVPLTPIGLPIRRSSKSSSPAAESCLRLKWPRGRHRVSLNKPTSSDTITITSCNPNYLPAVVPNYLHTPLTSNQLVNLSVPLWCHQFTRYAICAGITH